MTATKQLADLIGRRAAERRRTLKDLPVINVNDRPGLFGIGPFKKRQLFLPIVALTVLVVTLAAVHPVEETTIPVPIELIGWWNADDYRYSNRGFRLTSTTLTLHVPDSGPSTYPIESVRLRPDGVHRLYEVNYASTEGTLVFNFMYSPDSVIRFPNQSGLAWRRGQDPAERIRAIADSVVQQNATSDLPPGLADCIISVTSERKSGSGPVSCVAEGGRAVGR